MRISIRCTKCLVGTGQGIGQTMGNAAVKTSRLHRVLQANPALNVANQVHELVHFALCVLGWDQHDQEFVESRGEQFM